jgi:5-deoxy-D-glucuronate isomerase
MTLALVSGRVSIEVIEHDGTRYAEIIWADVQVEKTTFFSPPESSFQFGLLAHEAGYQEEPHYHKATSREISDLQQMFVMQRGVLDVQVFDDDGRLLREVRVGPGDAVVLIHGVHAIKVVEDFQALSVKQGPFLGDEEDKVVVETETAP